MSALDFTTEIKVAGVRVPGLTTRRVKTTVELRHGQSFAIAGLLQKEFANSIDQLPFAERVPVLGALFRSSDYRRSETELVVIVTPYLVSPAQPHELASPTDRFVPPTDKEFFLKGRLEALPVPPPSARYRHQVVGESRRTGGGLDGAVGHIIK